MNEKIILITGATGGVGEVVCGHLTKAGYRLVLTGRRQKALDALASKLGADADGIMTQVTDLTDAESVRELVRTVANRWGGVDILVNIAGGWKGGQPLAKLTDDDWKATLDLNLYSAFLVNRAVIPHMAEQGWGRIVNFSSKAALSPGPSQAAYNVAKAGLIALTQSIAAEYRRKGIAANSILPSIIDTPTNRKQMPEADYSRWVTPEQLASLILFLCSEEGGSLNGASMPVYGTV